MKEIYIVWFITILGVSAKYCDEKNSPSNDSIAILKDFCNTNNGSLSGRECIFKPNRTLGYVVHPIQRGGNTMSFIIFNCKNKFYND